MPFHESQNSKCKGTLTVSKVKTLNEKGTKKGTVKENNNIFVHGKAYPLKEYRAKNTTSIKLAQHL